MTLPIEELCEAAEKAVQSFFTTAGGEELSTGKFVIIAESIDADGVRSIWRATASRQKPWDTYGLLEYARIIEDTGTVPVLMDDDDDES